MKSYCRIMLQMIEYGSVGIQTLRCNILEQQLGTGCSCHFVSYFPFSIINYSLPYSSSSYTCNSITSSFCSWNYTIDISSVQRNPPEAWIQIANQLTPRFPVAMTHPTGEEKHGAGSSQEAINYRSSNTRQVSLHLARTELESDTHLNGTQIDGCHPALIPQSSPTTDYSHTDRVSERLPSVAGVQCGRLCTYML